jgi:hypothetical protein
LSPIFSLFTFYPTLHLPDLLQPACFSACLSLLCVSLCPSGTARVSLSVWVGLKGSLCLFATPQREGRQVSNTKPSAPYTGRGTSTGPSRGSWRARRVPRPCPSPFYPPILSPWSLLTNPTASSPLSCGSYRIPPTTSAVRKTKVEIRIHSENLVKTSIQKPKKIFYSTYPDLIDLKVVLKELRQTKNQKINSVQQTRWLWL